MALKHSYPKKYSLFEVGLESFTYSTDMWESSRGFIPSTPLTYTDEFDVDHLVTPLYNKYNELVSYQLRDINDTEVETKYKITKPVYDSFVKTDDKTLPGRRLICEGTIDCILLREHGVNAWTSLGLKKFKIIRLLEELEDEKFIYTLDNDQAGKYFCKKYFSKQAVKMDVPSYVKDINELFNLDKSIFLKWLTSLKRLTSA
jgi:hypothetical protein